MLSEYRIMWMFALFDLPVKTKNQRHLAAKFRNDLLKFGFSMLQFSVYARPCSSQTRGYLQTRIEQAMPSQGKVAIMLITDKQYGAMSVYRASVERKQKVPEQYTLF